MYVNSSGIVEKNLERTKVNTQTIGELEKKLESRATDFIICFLLQVVATLLDTPSWAPSP
jgi:hypothetical protein